MPINQELILVGYRDSEEGRLGLVLYYPTADVAHYLEADDSTDAQVKDMQTLRFAICELLYAMHRNVDPQQTGATPDQVLKFCLQCSPDLIFGSPSLRFLAEGSRSAPKVDLRKQKEEKVEKPASEGKVVKRQRVAPNVQRLEENIKVEQRRRNVDKLNEEMKSLALSDTLAAKDVAVMVEERLLQVKGNLFGYDGATDQQLLLAANAFLCIDRLAGSDSKQRSYGFMFNVTDMEQTVSYTRVQIKKEQAGSFNYSFSIADKMLMWMGDPKKGPDGELDVPAYSFVVEEPSEQMKVLQGVLTKVMFEANFQEELEKRCEADDLEFVYS